VLKTQPSLLFFVGLKPSPPFRTMRIVATSTYYKCIVAPPEIGRTIKNH
jgi:hypothetical protein